MIPLEFRRAYAVPKGRHADRAVDRMVFGSEFIHDQLHLLHAALKSGGKAKILREKVVQKAHHMARTRTGIRVSATGSAGLAGLLQLRESGNILDDEDAVLFFPRRGSPLENNAGFRRFPFQKKRHPLERNFFYGAVTADHRADICGD